MRLLFRQFYWFRRLGVGSKAVLVFAAYSLLMVTIIVGVAYRDGRLHTEQLTRERLGGLTLAGEEYIREFFVRIDRDVEFLAKSGPVQDMLAALAAEGGAPSDAAETARAQAERMFLVYTASRPAIYQARVIDAHTGEELVRIERDAYTGTFQPARLQNKQHRDYFAEILRQPPGRPYISAINLNREDGTVEIPFRPTVRVGRAVSGGHGEHSLIVLVNVGFRHLIFRLAQLYGDSASLMLFNADGQVLSHPDPSLEFDFDRTLPESGKGPDSESAQGTTLGDLFGPDAVSTPTFSPREGPKTTHIHAFAHDGKTVVLRRVGLHRTSDRALTLAAVYDPTAHSEAWRGAVEHSWLMAVGFLVFGAMVFVAAAAFLLRPLHRLVDQINAYEPGRSHTRPGSGMLDRQDEFGYLARGLRAMSHRVETQMHAARDARNEMRRVFDVAADAILLISDLGVIEDANWAAERLFGWRRHEFIGRRADILLPPEHAEILDPERIATLPASETTGTLEDGRLTSGVSRDGTIVPVTVTLTALGTGQWRRYVVTFRDMRAAIALESAREASAAKSRFLANMSHELRTPLNAVTLHAEMIADQAEEIANSDMLEDARNIKNAANHLLDLINGILDLARIESGRFELLSEPTELDSLVEEIHAMGVTLARKQQNAFVIETRGLPATATLDRVRLRQCVLNLISNAAKFTQNGRITVEVNHTPDELLIAVTDTGIGMTEEETNRVFEMFEQANSYVHSGHGGSGVGLALTRNIMDIMGGSVHLQSHPGEGARFELRVPLVDGQSTERDESPRTAPAVIPGPPTEPAMVLVVDSDAARRTALMQSLTNSGLRVIGAASGTDAADRAEAHRPHAIVAVDSPGERNSADIANALRNRPTMTDTPVLTVDPQQTTAARAVITNSHCARQQSFDSRMGLTQAIKSCIACGMTSSIVVIEDDVGMSRAITRAIERTNLKVIQFDNGLDALDHLRRSVPALVILDLALPGAGGFEIIQTIREDSCLMAVPITVVTGIDLTSAEEAWLETQCNAVLHKGQFDLDALTDDILRDLLTIEPACTLSDPDAAQAPPETRAAPEDADTNRDSEAVLQPGQ